MAKHEHFTEWISPRTVLALHDLTPQGTNAAWRAGLLARDQGSELWLLHAARGTGKAAAARAALERLASDIAGRLRVEARVHTVLAEPLDAVLQAAAPASLLVIGATEKPPLRHRIFGAPALQLLRAAGCPVLAVKKPATSGYRRVLVPVDPQLPGTTPAIAAATALSRSTRIDVFHSLTIRDEVTMRAVDLEEAEVRRHRQRNADRARARMTELIAAVPGAADAAVPSIAFGHAPTMVLVKEQAMRADLVVIGKRRRSRLSEILFGSVTQSVLAASRADVLVLPAVWETGADFALRGSPA